MAEVVSIETLLVVDAKQAKVRAGARTMVQRERLRDAKAQGCSWGQARRLALGVEASTLALTLLHRHALVSGNFLARLCLQLGCSKSMFEFG